MKKLLVSLMLLLPMAGAAQEEWFAAEADSALSALLSRQLVLPEGCRTNAFECIIGDTVIAAVYPHPEKGLQRELEAALQTWQDTSSVAPKTGVTHLYYSPVFYAETGDTLYCDGELRNMYHAYGEEAATYYCFTVRNHRETPYYMVVRRHNSRRALYVYDTGTNRPLMIERDAVYHPLYIVRDGQQVYLSENGKSIARRQVCHLDTFQYAEAMDKSGHVAVRYTFLQDHQTADGFWPEKKETLYPSGAVRMRTVYGTEGLQTTAFAQDGTEEELTPVPTKNIEKVIRQYFKENFKAPDVGREKFGIKFITMRIRLAGSISEKGAMTVKELALPNDTFMVSQPKVITINFQGEVLDLIPGKGEMTLIEPSGCAVTWIYKYDSEMLMDFQIKDMISASFAPYLREFMNGLTRTTFTCAPARIQQKPVSTPYSILFEYSFNP